MQGKKLVAFSGLVVLAALGTVMFHTIAKNRFASSPHPRTSNPAAKSVRLDSRSSSLPKQGAFSHSLHLPLSFEPNEGQADPEVKFLSHLNGSVLFLTSSGAIFVPKTSRHPETAQSKAAVLPAALNMNFVNPLPHGEITGEEDLPGKSNYFIGSDSKLWRTDVPQFGDVRYQSIYPGVDMVYYGRERELEFDFLVSPGADPSRIQFIIEGANCLEIDDHGDLLMHPSTSQAKPERVSTTNCQQSRSFADHAFVRFRKPDVYQETGGARHKIPGHYVLLASNKVGFELAPFDHARFLCIDPVLEYSTYLGGSDDDSAQGIAVDPNGNMYLAGTTRSTNFPTSHPFQAAPASFIDAFVTKLNAAGDTLIYSTYLGGTNSDDARAIAIDELGNAYIAGTTLSSDFPTASPLQPAYGGGFQDAFLTKLNPSGSALVYSTYLGGSGADLAMSLFVDTIHNVYLTGFTDSTNFPTVNAAQAALGGVQDAFVAKVNSAGSALLYSTYLGGNSADEGFGITVDSQSNAYITGRATSADFPVTAGVFQHTYNGTGALGDAFVSKLAASGSSLLFSTLLGGSGADAGSAVALDAQGNVYVTGSTGSTDFPITPGAFRSACVSNCDPVDTDAFVTKLNPTGTALVYSTYLGGNYGDSGSAIFVDNLGIAYIAGVTKSSDFPIASAIQSTCGGSPGILFECNADAFLSKLTANGSHLIFSSFLGGGNDDMAFSIAVVPPGVAYLTGQTQSGNFPTVHPFQATFGGGILGDAFVSKISGLALSFPTLSPMQLDFSSHVAGTTSAAQSITLTNEGDATLNISSIATSADYAQTNTCSATLVPAANCAISVTFAPAATGFLPGTLTITDDSTGSPQMVTLTGSGTDFPLAAATGANCPAGGNCTTSAIITAGQTATYDLQVKSVSGFNGNVALSCSGAPASATCSVSPASVPPNGSSSYAFTLTVNNTATAMTRPIMDRPAPQWATARFMSPLLPTFVVILLLAGLAMAQRCRQHVLVPTLAVFLLSIVPLTGCGGGGPNVRPPTNATITVTGTSSGVTRTLSLSITVNH